MRKIGRMDTSWSTQHHYWERVRWARLQWQQRAGMPETARAAAEALGMEENTLTTYERRPRSNKGLSIERARQFGKKYKVSWIWLALGEGTPFDDDLSPDAQSVARLVDATPEEDRPKVVEAIKTLLKRAGDG